MSCNILKEGTSLPTPMNNDETKKNINEEKELYFLILYRMKAQEKDKDFIFTKYEMEPQKIYAKEIKAQNGTYLYEKVFKIKKIFKKKDEKKKEDKNKDDKKKEDKKKDDKKKEDKKKDDKKKESHSKEEKKISEEIEIQFEIGKDNYIITFNAEDKNFYFDIDLEMGNKYLKNIAKKKIDQTILNYFQKLELFLAALKENKEEDKITILYKEIINLYSKKKGFYLLISLFINIYEKKNLCCKLIEEFYKINKEKKNDKNMDRKMGLDNYITIFKDISSRSEEIIKNYGYNPIYFYGLTFSYLNFYDYENFKKYFKQLEHLNLGGRGALYEILLIYNTNFLKQIDQDLKFFENFIDYTIKNKEFSVFENSLNYILYFDLIINVINKKKEEIIDKYDNDFKTIKIKPDLKVNKKEKGEEINNIIEDVESIIDFSRKKKKLLIYLNSNFWINILKNYNEPNDLNIDICFKLRCLLKNYYELIIELFEKEKNDEEKKIKEDIQKYLDRDEYAFILDKNVKAYIESNKNELSDSEILGYIEQYDPYFKEDKYKYKIDTIIFDYIKFDSLDSQFIDSFKKLNFEEIFKDSMNAFLNKMMSKITSTLKFGVIMDLINIERIKNKNKSKDKSKEYISMLQQKYDNIIIREIVKGEKIDHSQEIKIIAKFVKLLFDNDNSEKKEPTINFLKKKIQKLGSKISPLIYNELIIICEDGKYEKIRDFIFDKFAKDLSNIGNIIKLIDILSVEEANKNKFLERLMKECVFTREEFYSNNSSPKIILLCELYEKGKIKMEDREKINFGDIINVLDRIREDMEGDITKQKVEEFFKNKKEEVIKRLSLIKIILSEYNPNDVYKKLSDTILEINKNIDDLTKIKNSLLIFHRVTFLQDINEITKFIKEINEKNIKSYQNEETSNEVTKLKKHESICRDVEEVQDSILFKVIYDLAFGKDQAKRFEQAKDKLNKILNSLELINKNKEKDKIEDGIEEIYKNNKKEFDKIKDMICINESKADLLIKQIKKSCKINDNKENQELIEDLTILFKSKKYEMDLKSINFFFASFNLADDKWIKKLPEGDEILSKKDLKGIKNILFDLKNIYNYKEKTNYFRLFTALNEKKEAIDFLKSKINKDIKYLYDRIEPTNRTISIKKIEDCEKCIEIFKKFNECKTNKDLFEKIKAEFTNSEDSDKKIELFESFSKNYGSIIELDRNDNTAFNLFENVDKIIKKASLIFKQDKEDFCYYNENIKNNTNMEELIYLKNRINIKPQNNSNNNKDKDTLQIKCEKLIFFKENISNLELIYDNIKVLRTKGSSLPILIIIDIEYPYIKYSLNKKDSNFEDINDYLFRAKTEQILQLDLKYRQNKYLRFLYGKLFRRIIKHLDGEAEVPEIIRYILNKKDNIDDIKDGLVANPKKADDYVEEFKLYIDNAFSNISKYINTIFENNKTSLQNHYENILMRKKNELKGIYVHKCEKDESAEEYILKIFLEKIGKLPLSQNVLIPSKETSPEEIQAFFYRAILCDYNTLFVVEINNSFSNFQQNIMYNYINSILSYKNKVYNETVKNKVEKNNPNDYLKSCLVFVYEQNIKDNAFLIELEKFGVQKIGSIEKKDNLEKYFENVKIITSDICGLGKSHKIIKMINEEDKKKYYHFPLGGILTKEAIYKKLSKLLEKLKNENRNSFIIEVSFDSVKSKCIAILL